MTQSKRKLTVAVHHVYFCAPPLSDSPQVFGARSQTTGDGASPDSHITTIFAAMKPGARMVTLERLPLGRSQDDVNEERRKNGLAPSPNASFFNVREFVLRPTELGEAAVSWGNQDITAFVYTRTSQEHDSLWSPTNSVAYFLCENKRCECYRNPDAGLGAPAVTIDTEAGVLHTKCPLCDQTTNKRPVRSKAKPSSSSS